MLNNFKIDNTFEKLNFTDIKENVIVTNTHLVSLIEVNWANLFEKKEEEAISYLFWFTELLKELNFPVQLITQSRPKKFDSHINDMKNNFKQNDYKLKFEKDLEWFQMYYDDDLKKWKISKEEIEKKFKQSDQLIERSMMNSYIERLSTTTKENNILDKKYYIVISTLNLPVSTKESDEQNYPSYNFENLATFKKHKEELEKRVKTALNFISEKSWMVWFKLNTDQLKNLMFDCFNFPVSENHKIMPWITEYWTVPPILDWWIATNKKEKKSFFENLWEKIFNNTSSFLIPNYWTKENKKSSKSTNLLQLIAPFSIDNKNINHLKINDQYLYTIHINRFWDENLKDLALWPILTLEYYFDLSVHLIPHKADDIMLDIAKEKRRLELNHKEKIKWKTSFEQEVLLWDWKEGMSDLDNIENAIRNNRTNLYSTSIDITFRATSLEELDKIKTTVKETLQSKRIFFSETTWSHYDWFISTLPLLTNKIAWHKRLFKRFTYLIDSIRHFFPFCPDILWFNKGVALWVSQQWEWNEKTKHLEFFDIFERDRIQNSIMAVIWNSWSWKSVFASWFIKNQMLLWHRFIILDFLWNYLQWGRDIGENVNVIKIDPTSKDKINPCDLYIPSNKILSSNENYIDSTPEEIKNKLIDEKIAELSSYFRLFLKDYYDPIARWILDKTTKKVYQKALKSIDILKEKEITEVFLNDIKNELSNEKDHKEQAKNIASMLEPYSSWSFSWMFNSKTNIKIDKRSVVFYLRWNKSEEYEEMATLQSFIITKKIAYSSSHNILLIDELHKIFRMESREISNYFRSQIAMIRNLDWWVIWMTQLLKQVQWTDSWKEFLEMANTKLYLSWWITENKDDTDLAKFDTNLSNSSKSFLAYNNRPWFWILKIWTNQIQLKINNHPDLAMFERYKPPKEQ